MNHSEEQLRVMIDTIPALTWTCLPDGVTEFLNQRWLDYTGLSREESLGWGWKASIHPDDLGKLMKTWQSLRASGKPGDTSLFQSSPLPKRQAGYYLLGDLD